MVLAISVLGLTGDTTTLFGRATWLEGLQQERDTHRVKSSSTYDETWGLTHQVHRQKFDEPVCLVLMHFHQAARGLSCCSVRRAMTQL